MYWIKYLYRIIMFSSLLSFNKVTSFKNTIMKSNTIKRYASKYKIDYTDTLLVSKSEGQRLYKKTLYDSNIDLIVCQGPAGTGKTSLACDYALDLLSQNKINKIIITRPTTSIEENLGYLPGDINQKMIPWTAPIFDIFLTHMKKTELDFFIKEQIIEVCPLGFIQGRTFKNSIIIADEMQNSSPTQMFMLLTRIGENSKMIINGDLKQNQNQNNGLRDLLDKFSNQYEFQHELYEKGISIIQLKEKDIQRHKIISYILDIYHK